MVDIWAAVVADGQGNWALGGCHSQSPSIEFIDDWNLRGDFEPTRWFLIKMKIPKPSDVQWEEINMSLDEYECGKTAPIRHDFDVEEAHQSINRLNQEDIETLRDLLSQREQVLNR